MQCRFSLTPLSSYGSALARIFVDAQIDLLEKRMRVIADNVRVRAHERAVFVRRAGDRRAIYFTYQLLIC